MPTRVWIVAGPEWKRTAAQLRVVENRLPGWTEREMQDAIRPVVAKAKAAVRRVDVEGGPAGTTGLRRRIAAGVGFRKGISSKAGAYFTIYSGVNNPAERPIPKGLDQASGWRHPLFGNRDYWYQSRPVKPGWFTDTIQDGDRDIERAIARALDVAIRTVK